MAPNDKIQLYENKRIRTAWDEENEAWSGDDNPAVQKSQRTQRKKTCGTA